MFKITKGQLIAIWAFVLFNIMIYLGSGDSLGNYRVSGLYTYFVLVMLFALIYYTIGWRIYRKKNQSENRND
ncbi:MAG: hypothetical protein H8D23_34000 [Candidatus Brocadiales bacterium]|nr:hypothetical protein [Candidatus Brocadiales bacterium]